MTVDYLRLFNLNFVEPITTMDDEELWNFLMQHEEKLKAYSFDGDNYPETGALFAYPHGIEHFRKHFLSEIDEYREGVIFTLVADFCFGKEKVRLDYWAQGGFLDSSDSCDVKTSDEIMPSVDEDSEAAAKAGDYFHLLEPHHLEHIIWAMEENLDKSEINTIEDVAAIKTMREFCLNNTGYKAAYIYNRI